ncbi:adrenodoxin-like isoform X1 [Rhopalosiphum maidis]|uniref:adrenodoxin-like isoform X1 n=1 Tax=Rhopalosiphum maidis TaxID=43146 RepID=UPI000EFF890B|nr:adrenodoxin-like isoform X1 [Rhopalosiphum maidis]
MSINLLKYIITKSCISSRVHNMKYMSTVNNKKLIKVTFNKANGDKITAEGKKGDSLLDVIINNNLDFDGYGACEGTLTCSTCHVILDSKDYDALPDKPSDEELDMLDLAYNLTDTSRLGCQIILEEKLDGLEVNVPATVNDARYN